MVTKHCNDAVDGNSVVDLLSHDDDDDGDGDGDGDDDDDDDDDDNDR